MKTWEELRKHEKRGKERQRKKTRGERKGLKLQNLHVKREIEQYRRKKRARNRPKPLESKSKETIERKETEVYGREGSSRGDRKEKGTRGKGKRGGTDKTKQSGIRSI